MNSIKIQYTQELLKNVSKTLFDNLKDYQEDVIFILQSTQSHSLNLNNFQNIFEVYFEKNKRELIEWHLHFTGLICNDLKYISNDGNDFLFEYY